MSYNSPYGQPQGGYPGQRPQGGYPGQQPQGGYPGQQTPGGYPGQQPQGGYPGQQPQGGYPGQQTPGGYPGQQSQGGYPGQQPQGGYPGQQSQGGYPGQQAPSGYPGQQPQGGYPGQQRPSGGYPGQQQQGGYPGQVPGVDPNIATWFKAVDQDNSGQINSKELRAALQNGNWSQFSEEACQLMISMFDADHSGTINLQEFGSLFKYVSDWTNVYRKFDKDRSGTIEQGEMSTALSEMGYRLSPQFVGFLISKFDPRTRQITLDNFIVINVQLHRLTQAFRAKDTQMTGVVTMSYEEFITMAMTCT